MIKKYLVVIAAMNILLSIPSHAGIEITCPNLELNQSSNGWIVNGTIQNNLFKKVLISQTRVLGKNSVTCKYKQNLSLIRIGEFQNITNNGLWQSVNIGGVYFKQCIATNKMCIFFQL